MQTERQMATSPQTKPTDLACESAGRLPPSTSTIAIYIYMYHNMVQDLPVADSQCDRLRWQHHKEPTEGAEACSPENFVKI